MAVEENKTLVRHIIVKETYFATFEGGKIIEYVNLNRMID